MKIFSTTLVLLLMIFQTVAFAETGTFSASGEYLMSDYDTPEIAEEIALDFAKQNAAEQAGIYLESYSRSENFELEEDEIKTVASSKVEVLEKNISRQPQRDGRILLRADIKATVDTSELDNFIKQEREKRQAMIQQYKALQEMNVKIKQDIDEFQSKLAAIREEVKDDDLIVEQERINREFLSKQKMEQVNKKTGILEYDVTSIEEAIKINPKNAAAYVMHGFFSSPLLPDIVDINKAIILKPNEAALYIMRGAHYSIVGRFADEESVANENYNLALQNYDKAIELEPQNSLAYVNRAIFYEALEEYGKALDDYNKALELDPKNKEALQSRGDLYSKLKDPSKAAKDYELSMEGENKKFDGFDYVNLGDKYKEANDFPNAIENYTKAIETEPQFAHADHRFSAYNARATVYMGQGEYDRALADCEAGINLAKASSDNLAEFWIRELEGTKEKIDYTKKLRGTPGSKDFDTLTRRAFSYFAMDQYDLALNEINEAIKLDSGKAGAYYLRATFYERMGKLEEALADYDKAIELKPDYSSAYEKRQELLKIMYPNRDMLDIVDLMQRADSFMENKNYNSAVEVYTKILKAEPNYPEARFQRGRAYLLMKKYDLALTDYKKLIELNQNGDGAYNNRGWAYENLGEYDKALADYNKALELNPNNKNAKKNRQRVLDKMKK